VANATAGALSVTSPGQGSSSAATPVSTSAFSSYSAPGIPNPADYQSFDEFNAAVVGPYREDYIMQQWASVHGWQSQ
jgi:hypothetical protein